LEMVPPQERMLSEKLKENITHRRQSKKTIRLKSFLRKESAFFFLYYTYIEYFLWQSLFTARLLFAEFFQHSLTEKCPFIGIVNAYKEVWQND
jgi:hypothetical protein